MPRCTVCRFQIYGGVNWIMGQLSLLISPQQTVCCSPEEKKSETNKTHAWYQKFKRWQYTHHTLYIYIYIYNLLNIYLSKSFDIYLSQSIYIYLSFSIDIYHHSSSYRAGSTDIPDPLSPLLPIVHRPR